MKLRALLLSLLLAPCSLLVGQQTTAVQKGGAAGTNNITADLNIGTGRTLTIASGGTFTAASGSTLNLSAAGITYGSALEAIDGLTPAADKLAYFTSGSAAALTDFTAFGRTLVDDADALTARATLGLTIGTNVQAYDADLTTYAGITPAANTQSLLGAANYSAMRTLLTLVPGTDVQAYDADLLSIAGNATGGFLTRTAANTYTPRTLTAPAAGISVSNGDGVSGNPTLALANDLSALEGLASTGIAVRSASDTWVQRTIAGTSPVQVANGSGVSGNPTISVDAATTSASGIVELATSAETLAGTSTTLVPPVSALEARALLGDFTRQIRDSIYSDGATSNRRVEITPGTAGAVAALPISIPFEFQVPTSNPSSSAIYFQSAASANSSGFANELRIYVGTSGELAVRQFGATAADYIGVFWAGFRAAYSGLRVRGMVIFSAPNTSTTPTILIQGGDSTASFTSVTAGTPPNWIPSALDTTKFVFGHQWPAGRFIPHGPILGALTAAEVLEWTQTGRLPSWCEIGTGSAVGRLSNSGFETGTPPAATGWGFNAGGTSTSANVAGAGVGGSNAAVMVMDGSNSAAGFFQTHDVRAGRRYRIVFAAKVDSTTGTPYIGSDLCPNAAALTTSFATYEFDFVSALNSTTNNILRRSSGCAGRTITVDNVQLYDLGPIVKPVTQPGVVLRDAGSNNLPGLLTSGITPITTADRGAFTATLTWSGTHEGKSLIGAQAIPSNAIITRIWRKATVASSGSGCTIGTTNSATRWQALDTYTTAAEISTLANQLPAGTAANDLDIVVDPDTANYTGSITVTVEYQIVGGTP